jgi:hypothetical protein
MIFAYMIFVCFSLPNEYAAAAAANVAAAAADTNL